MLVLVAVPSRQDVEEYQNLRAVVNELVGRINGRFGKFSLCHPTPEKSRLLTSSSGTVDYMPIHFMHKSVNFDELLALYAISDACVVSSTRDGMNLVSYEYVASQEKRKGVLILSEFAGAAQSLNGSLVVNPWSTEDLANAYYEAVSMDLEQRTARYQKLWKYVSKYTRLVWSFPNLQIVWRASLTCSSAFWGQSFVSELSRCPPAE